MIDSQHLCMIPGNRFNFGRSSLGWDGQLEVPQWTEEHGARLARPRQACLGAIETLNVTQMDRWISVLTNLWINRVMD